MLGAEVILKRESFNFGSDLRMSGIRRGGKKQQCGNEKSMGASGNAPAIPAGLGRCPSHPMYMAKFIHLIASSRFAPQRPASQYIL
jgi:hypothetical protein